MSHSDIASEREITARAVNSFAHTPDARLRFLLQKLVGHLHNFASEVELGEAEWFQAIQFLTATGQKCDDVVRQEFILLSDVLGLSMLVDAIEHRNGAEATESTVFGPFYISGMPDREYGENMALIPGNASLITGCVRDITGKPLAGATLDVWQTAENGQYSGQDVTQPHGNLRGRYHTDEHGRYAIRSVVPVSYPIPTDGPVGQLLEATGRHPWRPAHLHFMLDAPGHKRLVTHVFNDDDPYIDSDAVFGVKDSLRVVYQPRGASDPLASQFDIGTDFHLASFDFVLDTTA
ncbi:MULTISPECIES: dioxygenase [unclassified Pseudomonas]|jgi:catechol 1,2-dioxygenase|uniref:dioxygenase family protein n=1 Tax=unclassified Pseudomonas TaxID=196821 RepID=UPI001CE15DB4|nr:MULTISPECIES: dioxygenase [unclassified Pseudomonas]MCA4964394.1 6-chlorohydroxyquinol-1,2-dioxygenase [Pseudomonas sp. Y24-6]MCH4876507.1 6-chlorohydroxyquinol-1,2-dioxygenase [Pseudomonas sp. TMW22090]